VLNACEQDLYFPAPLVRAGFAPHVHEDALATGHGGQPSGVPLGFPARWALLFDRHGTSMVHALT